MKRIICLIESLSSGGAERQMAYLASELKKAKYEVEVWTYYPDDFYLPILKENGVTYKYLSQATNALKRIPVLINEFKKAKPDVVISYLDTANIVACIIKALGAKFKLIVSERNTTQKISKQVRIKFACYKFADYIVPNSRTQGQFITNTYPKLQDKIHVITNFIDTERYKPIENKDRHNALQIIVAGRVVPQKNPLIFMHAIKTVRDKGIDINVTWFGNSSDNKYMEQCLNTVKELSIENCFAFEPSTKNIANLYPKYDVFCLPSLFEGFPNVLCEAMSCGLPILCSNVCDNPSIAIDEENGFLFDPLNHIEIAAKVEKIAHLSHEQRVEIGKKNRARIENLFSSTQFIEKYETIIES